MFQRRPLGSLRVGPRYSSPVLRRLLDGIFGTAKLCDLPMDVLICASTLNTFEGRVFSRGDKGITLVDAAMASAAAPTYFEPVVPPPDTRSYIDGGVWANDPSMVAMDHATNELGVDPGSVRMLFVGTGRVPQGRSFSELTGLRTVSRETVRLMLDSSSTLQSWLTEQRCASHQSSSRWIRVNPSLRRLVHLDDAARATDDLPPLADSEFDQRRTALLDWLGQPRRTSQPGPAAGATLLSYRRVLSDLTGRMNVPHATVRRYRYVIGRSSLDDRTSVSVTSTVDSDRSLLWRTEPISVTQDAPNVCSLADIDFSVTTDAGCDLDFLALEERSGSLEVMLVFVPEVDGPGSRSYTYMYAWPGTWDPLRPQGDDRAVIEVKGTVTRLEVTFVFPQEARNITVVPPSGVVADGEDADRLPR